MGVMTATTKAPSPVQAQSVLPPARKLVGARNSTRTRRKTRDFRCAFAPLHENRAAKIAPPSYTLGRSSQQVLTEHRLNKFDSRTITTSSGAPLPVAIKNPLSHSFSIDLTPIRVHTD